MSRFTARPLPQYLREEKERIEAKAAELGLDFFPTFFESSPTMK